tara:strand:- start:468 stop:776 length:309 start_codon:yes stop_codon:yes gene_type:complete
MELFAAIVTSLVLSSPEKAPVVQQDTTVVYTTRDLDFTVPNFNNAPRFSLNDSVRGQRVPFENPRDHVEEPKEDKLLDILREEYGDEYRIIRWKNELIVTKR